jgi:UPF0755 protein
VNNAIRNLLRLITLVVGISVVVVGLGGGAYYMWRDSQGRAPKVGFHITTQKLERAGWGLYLRFLQTRGKDYTLPMDPNDSAERTFVVESGDTPGSVGWNLEQQGIVTDGKVFRRVVQYLGAERDIQMGVYALSPSMTMEEIVMQLQHGRLLPRVVTIPEGWRVEEIAALLESEGVVTSGAAFVEAVRSGRSDYDFVLDRPADASASLEGFLFPDTYQFDQRSQPGIVVGIMLQNWANQIPKDVREKVTLQGRTLYDVVTLASIVEREAVAASERPLIAGVYTNRLKIGMYLQSDPTVQYAKGYDATTGKWWNPMVQEEAITVVSAYNTFLNPGLPPAPICNPGLASIMAVIEPTESDYLFFYHKGDGTHAFAVTYEEHLRNEQLYGGGGGE